MPIGNNYKRVLRKSFFALSDADTSVSIFIALALLAASAFALVSSIITPMTTITAFAQGGNNTTLTTTPDNATITPTTIATSEIELSPQPVYQDLVRGISEIPINQTHSLSTVAGNGTLTLPNSTEPIRTTSSGSLIVSMRGTAATAAGEQIVIIEGGTESATATLYEIARFNIQDGTGKGFAIAVVHTNSTGKLAPLNGMILAGQEEFRADGSRLVTMWEWESGIPLPPSTTMEEPPLMNTTQQR